MLLIRKSKRFRWSANSTSAEAAVSRKRPRSSTTGGRTRIITPRSVTGVSYATFCCLPSLPPALVLSCLERGINYNLRSPWRTMDLAERWRRDDRSGGRSICWIGFREEPSDFHFDRQMQKRGRRKSRETEEKLIPLSLSVPRWRKSPRRRIWGTEARAKRVLQNGFGLWYNKQQWIIRLSRRLLHALTFRCSSENRVSVACIGINIPWTSGADQKYRSCSTSLNYPESLIAESQTGRHIRESGCEYREPVRSSLLLTFIRQVCAKINRKALAKKSSVRCVSKFNFSLAAVSEMWWKCDILVAVDPRRRS